MATCVGSSEIQNSQNWETGAEQQFSPHYDGWGRNPRPSGPPTPRLGKEGGEVKEGGGGGGGEGGVVFDSIETCFSRCVGLDLVGL